MEYDFKYFIPSRVHFSNNILNKIDFYISELSMKNILVITDQNIHSLLWFKNLIERINLTTDFLYVCHDVLNEPTDSSINKIIEETSCYNFDGIIGIGGGSSMDTAKCVNISFSNGKKNIEYFLRPNNNLAIKKVPMILIPTTTGTGAEITRGAVIIDEERRMKRGFGNGGCYADIVLVDPTVGITLPSNQIATSGLDAFCHALEAYLVNKTNPICKQLSYYALYLIANNLVNMYERNDIESCTNMFLASLLATMSFSTGVGLTFSHHISDAIGGMYPVPHGFASFFTLAQSVEVLLSEEKLLNNDIKKLEKIFGESIISYIKELTFNLQVPEFTEYFERMSKEEINYLYEKISKNSYRASELNSNGLINVLEKTFMK